MTAEVRPVILHRSPRRAWLVHLLRVALLTAILLLLHQLHVRRLAREQADGLASLPLERLASFYPEAAALGDQEGQGGRIVLNARGESLGFVLQTAPASDRFIGFSGPTNLLLAFGPDERLIGLAILASRDTRDHVELIRRDGRFLASLQGLTASEAARQDVEPVSGATLTSLAIVQGLRERLGVASGSLRFPEPLTVRDITVLFPEAQRIEQDSAFGSLWHVFSATGPLGSVLRTSPAADQVIGYQGPTEARIGLGRDGRIIGVLIGPSFDNEPYTDYARSDEYFRSLFNGRTLDELARLDLKEAGVEGVSGATMTSMAVARGLLVAAQEQEAAALRKQTADESARQLQSRTISTSVILAAGLMMSFTALRGRAWFRLPFQAVLIVWLGLINGDLLSLAMFAGWAESGIPWRNALSLVLLTIAAVTVPVLARQNVYCSHLCPHGAVQQWLARWLPCSLKLPSKAVRGLLLIRPVLLSWVLLVLLWHWPFSLVDVEPFDAWAWRAAAWPTCLVAVLGLLASCFVPMAYCRFGCPTGAVLNYLRRHSRSDRLTRADAFALAAVLIAVLLWITP